MFDTVLDIPRRLSAWHQSASAIALSLPPALNQNGPTRAVDVVHYLAFVLLFGLVAYFGAFWILWWLKLLFLRRSYRTLHRAATVFGVAAVLEEPTIYLAHLLVPRAYWEVVEIGLMAAFVIVALTLAARTLWRGEPQPN
jgi:hypothetical protein